MPVQRYFLVGCPRSGTTLLQTMLAQHPQVFTFPESHYFQKIRGRFDQSPLWPLVSPRAAARMLDELAAALGVERPQVSRWWLGVGRYARAMSVMVDRAASLAGRTIWVEKSPVHLRHLDTISRFLPGTRFIHLVRDGRDVVASLVAASLRDPERWVPQLLPKGTQPTPAILRFAAADRWNADLQLSLGRKAHTDHLLIFYEDLIEQPLLTLEKLCSFLGVQYDTAMERHWESAEQVVGWRRNLQHMENSFSPLKDRRLLTFQEAFTKVEQEEITAALIHGGDLRGAGMSEEAGQP